ncbi:MAG TPA: hypothetical protein VHT28_18880 [Silvibacterium sp.]|nr:hypothetical protein [Silvibacterium sp.]
MDFDGRFGDGEAVEGDLLFGVTAWNSGGCGAGSIRPGDSGDGQRVDEGLKRGGIENGRLGLGSESGAEVGAESKARDGEAARSDEASARDQGKILLNEKG